MARSSRLEQAVALGALGVGLAAFRNFAPLGWPYGASPSYSLATQVWFFIVDLLWVAAMVATYVREPDGQMWKLFLLYRLVTTLGSCGSFRPRSRGR